MAALPDLAQTEIAIVQLTNSFRQEEKLTALKLNPALTAAARAFAGYLARTGKFAHAADGREPQERVAAQGYRYCLVAENLALNLDSRGFESLELAQEAMRGWKNSPGHRANLLLSGVTEIGVGIARAPANDPKFISVQLLARPEVLKIKFTIANQTTETLRYRLGDKRYTLRPRSLVTHTNCDTGQLEFSLGANRQDTFKPKDGDRFVVRLAEGVPRAVLERR